MSDPAFSTQRKAVQIRHREAIRKVANALQHWMQDLPTLDIQSLVNELKSFEKLEASVDLPELRAYIDDLDSLCKKHGLDFEWAPDLLFFEDVLSPLQLTPEENLLRLSGDLVPLVERPPVIMIPVPTALVYLGTKEEVHRYIDTFLSTIPKPVGWKDIPHALDLHIKWFYENRVLKKTPEDIAESVGRVDTFQIERAIRNVGKLLGRPRPRGRPKAS